MKDNSDIFTYASGEGQVSVVAEIDLTKAMKRDVHLEDSKVPVLPMRNMMIFPMSMLPINITRQSALKLLNYAYSNDAYIGVFCQKDSMQDDPTPSQLYDTGVLAKVAKVLELPNGTHTALLQGHVRIKLIDAMHNGDYLVGNVKEYPEQIPTARDKDFIAVVESCKDVANKFFTSASDDKFPNNSSRVGFINFLCSNIPLNNKERMELLELDMRNRAYKLLEFLNREYQFAKLKAEIHNKTNEEITKRQREHYLQEEMKHIQEELGEGSANDVKEFEERAKKKTWTQETAAEFEKQLEKLKHMYSGGPDYETQHAYLDTFLSLPWLEYTEDNLDLGNAEKVLNKDHFGMEKVKERILEHLAVLKMRGDFKSPIICLYGPPGVGKTSLGKSVARAMKRKYVRMSLGGLHDEAEIRGHRKTYIGAMPGRILSNIEKAGSSNPVFILDEIDKVGVATGHGDPSSALLEVLDPEQNVAFHDNYLDTDYDLSRVMFIATANNIASIPAPLLDRMELIEVSGYLTEEKIEIAKRHLIPQQLEKLGMKGHKIKLSKAAIEKIIENYTRESGVRELDKNINKLLRKLTYEYAKTGVEPEGDITADAVVKILGAERYSRDKYQGNDYIGVVTGLAWTAVGGEILFIETSLSKGKGEKLTLTGNLGDVMKESATLALEYLKAHSDMLGIDSEMFEKYNVHIHVPEGAVPKDGPSAGITITTALASALTGRKVRKNLAMTGEMTLRGKVLPVGGIKEKILAAKRAGITDIIICRDNEKDINEIPQQYVKGVTFHYVENINEVLEMALLEGSK